MSVPYLNPASTVFAYPFDSPFDNNMGNLNRGTKTYTGGGRRRRSTKKKPLRSRVQRIERTLAARKPECKYRRVNSEMELDPGSTYNWNVSSPKAHCIVNLTDLAQGTEINERIGHRIRVVFVEVRVWYKYGSSDSKAAGWDIIQLNMIKNPTFRVADGTIVPASNAQPSFLDDPDEVWTMAEQRIDYAYQSEDETGGSNYRTDVSNPIASFNHKCNIVIEYDDGVAVTPSGKSLALWTRPYKATSGDNTERSLRYEARVWFFDN